MNLQALDLNLLKVFEALAEERSATKAGDRIGLTQSSVSNALNRLRQVFEDDLFVRTPQGMMPTPLAEQLEKPIRTALSQLRDALANPADFIPAAATGAIRIAAYDFLVAPLARKLVRAITQSAPKVDLRFIPLDKDTLYSDLDADKIDLAIGAFFDEVPRRHFSRDYLRDRFLCIARIGHPAFAQGLTIEDYVAYPHILVSAKLDNRQAIDRALADRGLERRVSLRVGHIQSVPTMLAETDYLATISMSAAPALTALGNCETTPLPFDVPHWPLTMVWSRRSETDPLQAWARDQLVSDAGDRQSG
ncbi:MAG: LysR family transcriptional regulator [Pseudomonadota bacterium]